MSIFTNVRFLYCHRILCALCSRFLYVDDVLEGYLYRFDYMSITIVSALLQIYALSTTLVRSVSTNNNNNDSVYTRNVPAGVRIGRP